MLQSAPKDAVVTQDVGAGAILVSIVANFLLIDSGTRDIDGGEGRNTIATQRVKSGDTLLCCSCQCLGTKRIASAAHFIQSILAHRELRLKG